MKKIIFLFFFTGLITLSLAQTSVYHPFPTDSAIWTNSRGTYNVLSCCPPVVEYYPEAPDRYCMTNEDTVISAMTYSKIFYCGGAYKGGLRDDVSARKVYFVPADSVAELLIYDFSVENGDTAYMYYEGPWSGGFSLSEYYYIYTDSVIVNGTYRKRVGFGSGPGQWIEGIGGTQGLFREAWANVSNYYTSMECMSDTNTTLYPAYAYGACSLTSGVDEITSGSQPEIHPNPSNGQFLIRWPGQKYFTADIYDVLGSLVHKGSGTEMQIDLMDHPAGVYFVRMTDRKGNVVTKKIIKQ